MSPSHRQVINILFALSLPLAGLCAEDGDISLTVGTSASVSANERNSQWLNDASIKDYHNFSSTLGSSLEIQGSSILTGSYYAKMLLSTTLDTIGTDGSLNKLVSFDTLFFKSRLLDFLYLTVGKTDVDTFSRINGSNAGLAALDVLAVDGLNIMLLGYVKDVKNWDEISLAGGIAYDYDFLNLNGQVYLDRLQYWVGHAQVSLLLAPFSLSMDGTLKQRSDNYFFAKKDDGTWEGTQKFYTDYPWWNATASLGFSLAPISLSIGYNANNEGYTATQVEDFQEAIKAQPTNIAKYKNSLYDQNYLSCALGLNGFPLPGLNLNTSWTFSLDRLGLKSRHTVSYRINQNLMMDLSFMWNYSDQSSEYCLFNTESRQLTIGISFAF